MDTKPMEVYVLTDPREVEILSRCCRVWVDRETLDKVAIKLAAKVGRGEGLHHTALKPNPKALKPEGPHARKGGTLTGMISQGG